MSSSNNKNYEPTSTAKSPHYSPQGDRGSGVLYVPSAMPKKLNKRYSIPTNNK